MKNSLKNNILSSSHKNLEFNNNESIQVKFNKLYSSTNLNLESELQKIKHQPNQPNQQTPIDPLLDEYIDLLEKMKDENKIISSTIKNQNQDNFRLKTDASSLFDSNANNSMSKYDRYDENSMIKINSNSKKSYSSQNVQKKSNLHKLQDDSKDISLDLSNNYQNNFVSKHNDTTLDLEESTQDQNKAKIIKNKTKITPSIKNERSDAKKRKQALSKDSKKSQNNSKSQNISDSLNIPKLNLTEVNDSGDQEGYLNQMNKLQFETELDLIYESKNEEINQSELLVNDLNNSHLQKDLRGRSEQKNNLVDKFITKSTCDNDDQIQQNQDLKTNHQIHSIINERNLNINTKTDNDLILEQSNQSCDNISILLNEMEHDHKEESQEEILDDILNFDKKMNSQNDIQELTIVNQNKDSKRLNESKKTKINNKENNGIKNLNILKDIGNIDNQSKINNNQNINNDNEKEEPKQKFVRNNCKISKNVKGQVKRKIDTKITRIGKVVSPDKVITNNEQNALFNQSSNITKNEQNEEQIHPLNQKSSTDEQNNYNNKFIEKERNNSKTNDDSDFIKKENTDVFKMNKEKIYQIKSKIQTRIALFNKEDKNEIIPSGKNLKSRIGSCSPSPKKQTKASLDNSNEIIEHVDQNNHSIEREKQISSRISLYSYEQSSLKSPEKVVKQAENQEDIRNEKCVPCNLI